MFRLIVIILVIWGAVSVKADNHGCATEEKVNSVNKYSANLLSLLDSTINNNTLTENEKNAMILHRVCNEGRIDFVVRSIYTEVAACQDLIDVSSVKSLTVGALSFSDLFDKFQGLSNLCECVPSLMQAMAMNAVKDLLEYKKPAFAPYDLINVGVLCSNDAVANAVKTVAMYHETTCQNIWRFAEILNNKNVMIMNRFRELVCGSFNNTKFMCAVNGSATIRFSEGVADAPNSRGSMEPVRCERTQCVDAYIDKSCAEGRTWYMWAVNMQKDNADTFELGSACDVSKGVTSAAFSSSLILVAVLTSLLY